MKSQQVVGNILGGIFALIGLWRFIAGMDCYGIMFLREVADHLILQGFVLMAIGAGLLIWANISTDDLTKKSPTQKSFLEKWTEEWNKKDKLLCNLDK